MTDEQDFKTPIHPGEILLEEFMTPYGLSANKFASAISVPTNRITAILNGSRSVTAATALRLAAAFDTTPEFWLTLQIHYELQSEQQNPQPAISRISGHAA
jgi:antitoxin HigA-1